MGKSENYVRWVLLLLLYCIVLSCGKVNFDDDKIDLTSYEDGLVEVNGTELYYKIIGEGEPIVILHGGPGLDHNQLVQNIGKLSKDFQVIFYDQRGTGNSSAEIDSADINTATFVEDLESLRKEFDLGKMNLLGVSWGSMLAMQYAISYPDHLNTLILGCPMGASSDFMLPFSVAIQEARSSEDSLAMAEIRKTEAFKNGNPEALGAVHKLSFKPYFHPNNRHLAERVKYNYSDNTVKNRRTVSSLILRDYRDYDIHDKLQNIISPTLVIHGDSDPIPWEFAEQIHNAIPHSEFELLEDTGHFIFLEAEEEFLSLTTDFVNKSRE